MLKAHQWVKPAGRRRVRIVENEGRSFLVPSGGFFPTELGAEVVTAGAQGR